MDNAKYLGIYIPKHLVINICTLLQMNEINYI